MDARNARVPALTVLAILSVLAVSLWFVFDTTFEELYWREVVGPRVEKRYGFTLEYVSTPIPGREEMYVITTLTPGGAFGRAGVQAGDTLVRWIGYASRLDYFYGELDTGTRSPISLRVVNISHGGEWPRHARVVAIARPAG